MRTLCLLLGLTLCSLSLYAQPSEKHNLNFANLASQWDEAMPLGNGMIGALVWNKDNTLRLSLDRADLWDERKAFQIEQHNFKWVQEQIDNKNYNSAQSWGDKPYGDFPYPTKLPAATLSFDLNKLGEVKSNLLDIESAINTVHFTNGTVFTTYIHATQPIGYFEFTGQGVADIVPSLLPHRYEAQPESDKKVSVVEGASLSRLGYKQGTLQTSDNKQVLLQPTYDDRFYEVTVVWNMLSPSKLAGTWTITNNAKAKKQDNLTQKDSDAWRKTHVDWWKNYWSKSSITIPDSILEKQYYLEMYKLGAVARSGAPAITLQAVWTADNGGLPPWKGDFHNDLNTQLSYWPSYTANRLEEAKTFTDWLWKVRPVNKMYTKSYFGVEGLNIPGVLTLSGYPMGGWIQYALSPTVSAWTAHHFYWQWKYSMDNDFLKEQAYTYITEAASFLKNISFLSAAGKRYLPISSSPEYNGDSVDAWFKDWTNFDLALAHFLFAAAAEVNQHQGNAKEEQHWLSIKKQLPNYAEDATGLHVAVGQPMEESHRHMSPYMAIYPLNLLDVNDPKDALTIKNSLRHLEKLGSSQWVGYSFSWIASLHARAKEAEQAVSNLQKFATNFCSINSFHVNGDQKGGQYANSTYRPFTLEGNFAFAQGVHELLIQSKKNYIEVFPAIPSSWRDVSFENLRTEGGFLISASKKDGKLVSIQVEADADALFQIRYEGKLKIVGSQKQLTKNENVYAIRLRKGDKISLKE